MTRLLAQDRAERIWGRFARVVGVRHVPPPYAEPWTEWSIEVLGDNPASFHGIDCNGHVSCGHPECIKLEAERG